MELLNTLNDCEIEVVKFEGGKFFDGVLDGIIQLANAYTIFLVSNCQEWDLNLFLKFSGLRAVFAGFDCHGMSGLPKHEMLSRIKSEHSLNNPVYIGDTASDETAAKLAHMAFIYVSWGFGKPEGEAKTVHSFAELLGYLSLADNC
jgi:phosphoglycolate phosphatase